MSPRTVVVGGGLAGLAAALECTTRGDEVLLLESRPKLGGLAGSFPRSGPAGDLWVDTGQHVFLRCCAAYRRLLADLGVAADVMLQRRLDIPVVRPGTPPARLRRSPLPAPAHLAPALARYRLLAPVDRLRAARAALALRRVDPTAPASDATSFGEWLTAHGQNARTVTALWDLVGVAALNAPAARASLALAATVFRTGLLDDARAGDIGWSRVPLQHLHGDAAVRRLEQEGAEVRVGDKVRAMRRHGARWRVTTQRGSEHDADQVVLAVPAPAAEHLLPPGSIPFLPGWAGELGSAPIVNLHVVYDRPVLDRPFVAAVGSPVQWTFDRTGPAGLRGDGQYLAVSLSAAGDRCARSSRSLRAEILPALETLLPAARSARVLDCFVTREPRATFDPRPGQAALRPGPVTAHPGLVLAGAWTDTGWPATMEGAVRSGVAAANALHAGSAASRPELTAAGVAA